MDLISKFYNISLDNKNDIIDYLCGTNNYWRNIYSTQIINNLLIFNSLNIKIIGDIKIDIIIYMLNNIVKIYKYKNIYKIKMTIMKTFRNDYYISLNLKIKDSISYDDLLKYNKKIYKLLKHKYYFNEPIYPPYHDPYKNIYIYNRDYVIDEF